MIPQAHDYERQHGEQAKTKRGVSRRTFIVILICLITVLVVAGSCIAFSRGWENMLGSSYRAGDVNAVVWSPDGKRIASASQDETVQVWDATDGGNVFTYRGHFDWVLAVAWSPDGKRIASGGEDKTVQVWDAADGGNVFTYQGHPERVKAGIVARWQAYHLRRV